MPESAASPRLPIALFLALSLLAGAVEIALFPPFAIADETGHFVRAAAISEGRFIPEQRGERVGSELPAGVANLRQHFRAALPEPAGARLDPADLREPWRAPAAAGERVFVDYRHAAQFTPLPYLAPAAGIAAARALGAPPLGLFYAGRVANALAAIALTGWAIALLPFGRWTAVALALLPMATTSRVSFSADATTTAIGWLLVAALLRLAHGDGAASGARRLALAAAALGGLCKPWVYLPLVAPALGVPQARCGGRGRRGFLGALLALALAGNAIGSLPSLGADFQLRPEGPPTRSAWFGRLAEDPLEAPRLILGDYFRHLPRYFAQLCGLQLGWLDVQLPWAWLGGTALLLLLLVALDGRPKVAVRAWERAASLAALAAIAALIALSQLLMWTPLGAPRGLEGVVGRYFLPAALLVLPIVQHRRAGAERLAALAIVVWRLATAAVVLLAALDRYWR